MTVEHPSPDTRTPAADVHIDAALVSALLRDQHPDLSRLPLEPLAAGWDNIMFRLGSRLAVRLPRRAVAAVLIEHEQRWLPQLVAQLPTAIPAPVRIGVPGAGYPWHWSVVPWLPGAPADTAPLGADQGARLAGFLQALHVAAPADAPSNPVRGVPLASRREVVEARLERLQRHPAITEAVLAAWRDALDAPAAGTDCWVHGDLHARNVLVEHGALSAVIDWGDICGGDAATDLAAVWMLLDDATARRQAIQACVHADAHAWRRARGWAVSFGCVLLETGLADLPRHAVMGEAILRRLAADA